MSVDKTCSVRLVVGSEVVPITVSYRDEHGEVSLSGLKTAVLRRLRLKCKRVVHDEEESEEFSVESSGGLDGEAAMCEEEEEPLVLLLEISTKEEDEEEEKKVGMSPRSMADDLQMSQVAVLSLESALKEERTRVDQLEEQLKKALAREELLVDEKRALVQSDKISARLASQAGAHVAAEKEISKLRVAKDELEKRVRFLSQCRECTKKQSIIDQLRAEVEGIVCVHVCWQAPPSHPIARSFYCFSQKYDVGVRGKDDSKLSRLEAALAKMTRERDSSVIGLEDAHLALAEERSRECTVCAEKDRGHAREVDRMRAEMGHLRGAPCGACAEKQAAISRLERRVAECEEEAKEKETAAAHFVCAQLASESFCL